MNGFLINLVRRAAGIEPGSLQPDLPPVFPPVSVPAQRRVTEQPEPPPLARDIGYRSAPEPNGTGTLPEIVVRQPAEHPAKDVPALASTAGMPAPPEPAAVQTGVPGIHAEHTPTAQPVAQATVSVPSTDSNRIRITNRLDVSVNRPREPETAPRQPPPAAPVDTTAARARRQGQEIPARKAGPAQQPHPPKPPHLRLPRIEPDQPPPAPNPPSSRPAPSVPPPLEVRIGTVEVQAPAQTQAPAPGHPAPEGFATYRRLRSYRGWGRG